MHYKRYKEIEDMNSSCMFFKLLGKAYIKIYSLHIYLLMATSKMVRVLDNEDCRTGPLDRYHHIQPWRHFSEHSPGEVTFQGDKCHWPWVRLSLPTWLRRNPYLERGNFKGPFKLPLSRCQAVFSFFPQSISHVCMACHDCDVFGDLKKVFII